jgi:hypothetical protein
VLGDDVSIHNLLTAKSYTKPAWVSVADFNSWCASHNAEYLNIEAIAGNVSSPYFSAGRALLRCLNGAVNSGAINTADSLVLTLLNAWPFVDTTGAAKTALISLGQIPASRADILGIDCSLTAIRAVIWNDDGTRRI